MSMWARPKPRIIASTLGYGTHDWILRDNHNCGERVECWTNLQIMEVDVVGGWSKATYLPHTTGGQLYLRHVICYGMCGQRHVIVSILMTHMTGSILLHLYLNCSENVFKCCAWLNPFLTYVMKVVVRVLYKPIKSGGRWKWVDEEMSLSS